MLEHIIKKPAIFIAGFFVLESRSENLFPAEGCGKLVELTCDRVQRFLSGSFALKFTVDAVDTHLKALRAGDEILKTFRQLREHIGGERRFLHGDDNAAMFTLGIVTGELAFVHGALEQ